MTKEFLEKLVAELAAAHAAVNESRERYQGCMESWDERDEVMLEDVITLDQEAGLAYSGGRVLPIASATPTQAAYLREWAAFDKAAEEARAAELAAGAKIFRAMGNLSTGDQVQVILPDGTCITMWAENTGGRRRVRCATEEPAEVTVMSGVDGVRVLRGKEVHDV